MTLEEAEKRIIELEAFMKDSKKRPLADLVKDVELIPTTDTIDTTYGQVEATFLGNCVNRINQLINNFRRQ